MNTTTKPGVLAVLDAAIARAGGSSHAHLNEARATVERLAGAAAKFDQVAPATQEQWPDVTAQVTVAAGDVWELHQALAAFWGRA